jgi:carbon monoxide dehydrogenase subunit G
MKMSGEQRIGAPRDQVWTALNDPEILRRSIPGCQSVARESDTRMVATVEIKIGPIGARFNGSVDLSDIVAPDSYTMTMEGQGGTVGAVKSIVKVRLVDDGASATVLTYDVDAQVSGRLAQLGGPIMDATARQLAAKFFSQFGATFGASAPTQVGGVAPVGTVARAPVAAGAAAGLGSPVTWLLSIVVASLVGYLIGHGGAAESHSDWMGIAIGLLLMIVGAAGFEFGRRAAAPVVTIDANLLARLLSEDKR